LLNKKSGLFGVSQISPNLKDLIEVYASNPKAKLAVDMYLDRVVKEIGAQISGLGGIDILTFTAGVGQRSPFSRQKICQKLEFLGLKLDLYLNQNSLEQGQAPLKISSQDSQIEVWIIPTGEQIQIAREVAKLLD
jgi:acetate kinase